MTSVLPTILRRLRSNWSRLTIDEHNPERDLCIADHPMPDFVPRQLFSDLKLPEVDVEPENSRQGGSMPVVQAMKALAPGKVTRRFATDRANQSHWIAPLDLSSAAQTIAVQTLCAEYDELAPCQIYDGMTIKTLRCLRPWKLRATEAPQHVLPTSNAMLDWRTQIAPEGPGLRFEAPAGSPWAQIIRGVDFHVHQHGSHALIRRFAISSHAGIRFRDGRKLTALVRYVDGATSDAAAVGFDEECDGLVVRMLPPVDVGLRLENSAKLRALRSAYFRDLVLADETLSEFANAFQRGWICQVFLSTLISTALEIDTDLRSACNSLVSSSIGDAMSTVMETIFQVLPLHEDDDRADEPSSDSSDGSIGDDAVDEPAESSADSDPVIRQRVHQELEHICREPTVGQRLVEMAAALWNEPTEPMRAWMLRRFKSTLGLAILSACQSLVPQSAGGDLLLDLDPGPRPLDSAAPTEGIEEIWISESTPGGAGVIEQILESYADDPRRFFQMIESALAPSDSEIVDAELTRLLELAGQPGGVADRMQAVRAAEGIEDLYRKHRSLLAELSSQGVLVSHPVMAAAQARVLRPGSSDQSDALLLELVRRWNQQEQQLGVEIDARVFAYVASHDATITDRLFDIVQMAGDGANWAFNVLYGLLWPRGGAPRSQSLKSYNPFGDHPEADRDVVLDAVRPSGVQVALSDPNWREQVTEALASSGLVRLTAPSGQEPELKQAAVALAAQPVEIDFLNLYPQLHGIERSARGFSVTLRLREAVQ